MKLIKTHFAILFLFAFVLTANAQLATFDFRTVTDNGDFSPKHVLAVWIEKSDGTFVKTVFLRGNNRKQYLYTWNNKSGGSTVDAKTGATLSSHSSHSVQWNCRGLNGNIVSNGTYKYVVEYTDQHAQGPKYSVEFNISNSIQSVTATDQTYFKDMSVAYDPNGVGIEEYSPEQQVISIFPNPSNGEFNIQLSQNVLQNGNLEIVDISGKKIFQRKIANSQMSETINLKFLKLSPGVYFVVFRAKNQIARGKIVIQ